ELDRDQVVTHVEAHARVFELGEAALVRRQLLGRGLLGTQQVAKDQQRDADTSGHDQEQQGRQIFGQHSLFSRYLPRRRGRCSTRRVHDTSKMVPKGGLEPPRPKPLPPQGSASTNSATWASEGAACTVAAARNCKPSYCV